MGDETGTSHDVENIEMSVEQKANQMIQSGGDISYEGVTELTATKELRRAIQKHIDFLEKLSPSREVSLAKTKLEEGKMWLGKQMGNLGEADLNAERDAS